MKNPAKDNKGHKQEKYELSGTAEKKKKPEDKISLKSTIF